MSYTLLWNELTKSFHIGAKMNKPNSLHRETGEPLWVN